jgi:hypothetical protein
MGISLMLATRPRAYPKSEAGTVVGATQTSSPSRACLASDVGRNASTTRDQPSFGQDEAKPGGGCGDGRKGGPEDHGAYDHQQAHERDPRSRARDAHKAIELLGGREPFECLLSEGIKHR